MDLDFDKELINLIKTHSMLYEKDLENDTSHLDLKEKFNVWSHIAILLNRDTNYCILRWKSLREKYSQERKLGKESKWELLDHMKFIEKQEVQPNLKIPDDETQAFYLNNTDAEELIELILEDDEDSSVQKAVDVSDSSFIAYNGETNVLARNSYTLPMPEAVNSHIVTDMLPEPEAKKSDASVSSIVSQSRAMKCVETLLEGIGGENRFKAEKRIVAYLCKCQLKILNNEDIDDVVI